MDITKPQNHNMWLQISAAEVKKPVKERWPRCRPQREDTQCHICKLYGHRANKCNLIVRLYWCLQYIQSNPNEAKVLGNDYCTNNTLEAKQAMKAIIQQAFATENNLDPNIDTYDADMLDCLWEFKDTLDDTFAQVNTMTILDNTPERIQCPIVPTSLPIMDKETIASLSAPKEIEILLIPTNLLPYTYHHNDFHTSQDQNDNTQAFIRVLISKEESQSNTGANRHLTNSKTLLQNFHQCEPFPIRTIEHEAAIQVTGKGMTSITTTDLTAALVYETLYSADASGSVFSPQKYANDNKDKIGWWSKFADTKSQNSAIVFFNHNCNPLTMIPLYPRNGLFYMKMSQPE